MKRAFGKETLSSLCMELHLVLRAGISVSEGFLLLAEDEKGEDEKNFLLSLSNRLDSGIGLSESLRDTGAFPRYMVQMIEVGEQTGRLESVFLSLSVYYDRQASLSRSLRSGVLYPLFLFVLMLAVLAILVIAVLPIFHEVFLQLGGAMPPLAMGLLHFGTWLKRAGPLLLCLLALLAAAVSAFVLLPGLYALRSRVYAALFSKNKLKQQIDSARFAAAMAMAIASGLDPDASLEMAQKFSEGAESTRRIQACRNQIAQGENFSAAIAAAGLFAPLYCRMLSVGIRTGRADTVMEEIARRIEEDANLSIERALGRVEPILVVILSGLVGLVLLSVMLPLMGILSSIA